MKHILYIIYFWFLFSSCSATIVRTEKINGISLVASKDALSSEYIDPIISVNANYAAIMPFGFIRDLSHPEIVFNTDRQWFGETKAGAQQYIDQLKEKNIKVMLKPHIWVWRGEFTGFIEMDKEEVWKMLEESYSKFILDFAELAEVAKVDIFCIGTELEKFIANRPTFWNNLILEIKKIYHGKLTYAANWDEFKRTPFWDDLDYIGVDAYFPVSDEKTPTVEQCLEGWNQHSNTIKELSYKHNKPILFTEFGYRSVDHTGKEPWKSDRDMNTVNLEAQANATQALFEKFWKEDWFAGGFIWKWHHNYEAAGGYDNTQFTPQNKPVEDIVRKAYSNN